MSLHMYAEKGRKWAVLETIGRDRSRGDSLSRRGRMTSNVINVRYSPAKNRLCSHFSGRSLMNSIQVIFHVLQVEAMLIDGNEGSPQLMMWMLRRIKNSFFGRTDGRTCDRHLCRAAIALKRHSSRLSQSRGTAHQELLYPQSHSNQTKPLFYPGYQKTRSRQRTPPLSEYLLFAGERILAPFCWTKADPEMTTAVA